VQAVDQEHPLPYILNFMDVARQIYLVPPRRISRMAIELKQCRNEFPSNAKSAVARRTICNNTMLALIIQITNYRLARTSQNDA
jgi:hypothetical protein